MGPRRWLYTNGPDSFGPRVEHYALEVRVRSCSTPEHTIAQSSVPANRCSLFLELAEIVGWADERQHMAWKLAERM
jgi:hypothetical protein